MICISCKTEHDSNFCPNCGEKSGITKITSKSIIEGALSTISNMDKGFLYNLKMMIKNPKSISIDYILGKRKGILNPISFLIFSVSLYLIIENVFKVPRESAELKELPEFYIGKIAFATGKYIHTYFKYFWILSIIPLAVSTKLFFRKYTYIEHLAINSFILGQASLVGVVSYIILKIAMPVNPLVYLIIFWLVYKVFMTEKDKSETFLLSLVALIFFIIELIIIIICVAVFMV